MKKCLSQGRRLKSRDGMSKRLACLLLISKRRGGGLCKLANNFKGKLRCDSLA